MTAYNPRYIWDPISGAEFSYKSYLQAREFTKSVNIEIERSKLDLIGSSQQLALRGISAMESSIDGLNATIEAGFSRMTVPLEQIHGSIGDLDSRVKRGFSALQMAIEWGFADLIAESRRMSESLSVLVSLVRTPSETWALEQFDIARTQYRQGLLAESKESVDRAINGFGSQTGLKTNFMFHVLRGAIHMGRPTPGGSDTLDLDEAVLSFKAAARYAEGVDPSSAANSLFYAGRCAFLSRDLRSAYRFTEEALAIAPYHSIALFQKASLAHQLELPVDKTRILGMCFALNTALSVAAASSIEFRDGPVLPAGISIAQGILRERLQQLMVQAAFCRDKFGDVKIDREGILRASLTHPAAAERIDRELEPCRKGLACGSLMELEDRINWLLRDFSKVFDLEADRLKDAAKRVVADIKSETKTESERSARALNEKNAQTAKALSSSRSLASKVGGVITIIVCVYAITLFASCTKTMHDAVYNADIGTAVNAFWAILIGSGIILFIGNAISRAIEEGGRSAEAANEREADGIRTKISEGAVRISQLDQLSIAIEQFSLNPAFCELDDRNAMSDQSVEGVRAFNV